MTQVQMCSPGSPGSNPRPGKADQFTCNQTYVTNSSEVFFPADVGKFTLMISHAARTSNLPNQMGWPFGSGASGNIAVASTDINGTLAGT